MLPGFFAGGTRRLFAEAGPVLAVAALAILAQLAFDVRLPAAAELPFQIVLVALAAVMLIQRRRPARFFALVVLAFVLTGLWRPGFNQIQTMRSFSAFISGQRPPTAATGCSGRASQHDARWGRAWLATTLLPGAASPEIRHLFYFGGTDLGEH